MYLSTKLALSSVIIGSLLASIIQPAQAAIISFTPTGDPLDGDPILDIATNVGATQTFVVSFNQPTPAEGNVEFPFTVNWDSSELELNLREKWNPDVPPNYSQISVQNKQNSSYTFQYVANKYANPGIIFDFKVLPGLRNDGEEDFWVSMGANGEKNIVQKVEVQCCKSMLNPNSLTNYFALIPSSLFSLFFGEPAFAGELNSCSSCPVPEPITGVILGGLAAGAVMMNRKKNKTA